MASKRCQLKVLTTVAAGVLSLVIVGSPSRLGLAQHRAIQPNIVRNVARSFQGKLIPNRFDTSNYHQRPYFRLPSQVRSGFNRGTAVGATALVVMDDDRLAASLVAGNYLAKELFEKGYDVTVALENDEEGIFQLPGQMEFMDDWEKREEATKVLKIDDVLDPAKLKSYDYVIDLTTNASSTATLIENAKSSDKVERYVYISSASVYGPLRMGACKEDDGTAAVHTTREKVHSEQLVRDSGLPFTIVRSGYVIGPLGIGRQPSKETLENYFFNRHINGKDICIPGHGQFMVGLVHALDLADGIIKALESPNEDTVYNLQAEGGITMDGIALEAAKACGVECAHDDLIHFEERHFEYMYFQPDEPDHPFPIPYMGHLIGITDKAKRELNWSARLNASEAIADSYEKGFRMLKEDNLLPELNDDFDMIVQSNPHKQSTVYWLQPIMRFARPISVPDHTVKPSSQNDWKWE